MKLFNGIGHAAQLFISNLKTSATSTFAQSPAALIAEIAALGVVGIVSGVVTRATNKTGEQLVAEAKAQKDVELADKNAAQVDDGNYSEV